MSTVTKPIMLDETGEDIVTKLNGIKTALDTMAANEVTMTITATATDSVSCAGQTIQVYDAASGVKFTEFVYSGQPQSVVIPKGMSYRVVPTVTLAKHYCDDVASGIAMTNVAVTLSYKSVASVTTFPAMKSAVEAGLLRYFDLGHEISFTHSTEGEMVFELVNIDLTTQSADFVLNRTLESEKQFDTPEALLQVSGSAMAAGSYTFKNGSTSYYFTLANSAPIGAQIRATTSAFEVFTTPYDTIASESGTVSTTAISGATDLGTCASGVLNHRDRIEFGSDDYGESNIAAWLASDDDGGDWWTPKTMFDRPPSFASDDGFLKGVPQTVLDSVDLATISVGCSSIYVAPDSQHSKGTAYNMQAKFYLPSQNNLFGQSDMPDVSKQFKQFLLGGDSSRIRRYNGSVRTWWLRSPYTRNGFVRVFKETSLYNIACNYFGVVPACKISKSTI